MIPSMDTIVMILVVLIMIVAIDSIYKRLKPYFYGRTGEIMAAIRLRFLPKDEYKVLNTVLLKTRWGKCQIDHVIVSIYGIFVLETKNYKGTIYGGDESERWTQFLNKKKYELINPIKQNQNHINALKEMLNLDGPFYSIIVFNNKAKIKSNAENAILTKQSELIEEIKNLNNRCLSLQEVERITKKIERLNIDSVNQRVMNSKKSRVGIKTREFVMSDNYCPECGAKLTKRKSKYGDFISCSNYPGCNYTHKFIL